MRTELLALLGLVLVAAGCSSQTCIRDSDCPSGVCAAAGVCFVVETDAGPDDAAADAPDDAPDDAPEYRFDALDITDGPELDAATDAPVDAGIDAPTDAPVDAVIDAVPWREPLTFPDPDRMSR